MLSGIVGKPNSGKSTFFCAATMVDAEIGNRPFVTIKPNHGVGYVVSENPGVESHKVPQPVNYKFENGKSYIPVKLLDVAGLVEGAWQGKGLGNQFLNDLIQADALIHVLDASGSTDAEGNAVGAGNHDPAKDVLFLEREMDYWIKSILTKNWQKISKQATVTKKAAEILALQLTGLGITEDDIKEVLKKENFSAVPDEWNEDEILRFSSKIREKSKPMLIAANKMDLPAARENLDRLRHDFPGKIFVECCAEAELALRKADRAGVIKYLPGAKGFEVLKDLPEKQVKALDFIKAAVLEKFGSTGVQDCLNKAVFELLDLIAVYPVQDQNKWVSGKGNCLPDAYLLKRGSKPKDLAIKIHTDFGPKYIGAIDCKTGLKLGEDAELKHNDVVKILLKN
ncbi:MAG: redox-regulated ATPase YchF [Candidatus Diapherotrites archaeon]|nr:redox-regulated ATPase YchF [Candidatus Diapherotrites archaeon]